MDSSLLNILLADDDLDDRNFFSEALKKLPSPPNLSTVSDGEQLMQLLTTETTQLPDILFLDINMPRKDGLECLIEIKTNAKLKNIPIIMFSTTKSKDTVSAALKTGASVYIHKPGDFKQLVQVVHHALYIASENEFSKGPIKYILNA